MDLAPLGSATSDASFAWLVVHRPEIVFAQLCSLSGSGVWAWQCAKVGARAAVS